MGRDAAIDFADAKAHRSKGWARLALAFAAVAVAGLLAACGGGGGAIAPVVPITVPVVPIPHDFDCDVFGTRPATIILGGWCGRTEFTELLDQRIATGEAVVVDNRILIADRDFPHRQTISIILKQYNSGAEPLTLNAPNEGFVRRHIEGGGLPNGGIVSWSASANVGRTGFNIQFYEDRDIAVVIAVGNFNNPAIEYPAAHDDAELQDALDSGLFLWVAGSDSSGTTIDRRSRSCGNTMTHCILAPFNVRIREGLPIGTSFSVPQVVAALDLLRTMWPSLDNKMAISIVLETARDISQDPCAEGIDEVCGRGALDFTALFNPYGDLTVSFGGSGSGTSRAFERGTLWLPGMKEPVSAKGYDAFGRDFELALVQGSVAPEMDFISPNFVSASGSNLAASGEAIAYCRVACLYYSTAGEAGISYANTFYASVQKSDDFFGGRGTGSFALGDTTYFKAGLSREQQVGDLRLRFGLDVAMGSAESGDFVRDVSGVLWRPSVMLERQSGAQVLRLEAANSRFSGGAGVLGESYWLDSEDFEFGATWKLAL